MTRLALAALVLLGTAGLAAAERVALVIGNARYAHAPDAVSAQADAVAVARALRDADYGVSLGIDLTRAEMRERLGAFAAAAEGAEQAVIYLSGHAVRSDGRSYAAPVDAAAEDVVAAVMDGVPLELVLHVAGLAEGDGIVFLDAAQLDGFPPGASVEPGFAPVAPPPGVLLVSAAAPGRAIARAEGLESRFARLVIDRFLEPGVPAMELAREIGGGLWTAGAVAPETAVFPAPPPMTEDADLEREIEIAVWEAAERSGAAEDYRAYLDRYPDGAFAPLAANRLAQIRAAARDPAEAEEAALGLGAAERRAIQADLRRLGHDPRGVDGIFGPATRRAIRGWQAAEGLSVTGYLTRDQLALIARAAEEAEREAARREAARAAAAAAADDAVWRRTGADGTEAGLRRYLERYPDGRHAATAEARLERLLEARRDAAIERERRLWARAAEAGTAAAYRRYLARYPGGAFHSQARRRIARLEAAERARAEERRHARIEASLGLAWADRRAVERRLTRLNYDPGPRDGVLDARARQAIAAFQGDNRLAPTGYLDRRTLIVLIRRTGGVRGGPESAARVIERLSRAMARP